MCDTSCGCSSNQKSNKCNSKKYTSELTYDGENPSCSGLNVIKKNCTSLNSLFKTLFDFICSLKAQVDSLPTVSGMIFAFFNSTESGEEMIDEAERPFNGLSYTVTTTGTYQIHFGTLLRFIGATPYTVYLRLYINNVLVQEYDTFKEPDAGSETCRYSEGFFWRAENVAEGTDIEMRYEKLTSASQVFVLDSSMLINKE
jgi:hypothetical protein